MTFSLSFIKYFTSYMVHGQYLTAYFHWLRIRTISVLFFHKIGFQNRLINLVQVQCLVIAHSQTSNMFSYLIDGTPVHRKYFCTTAVSVIFFFLFSIICQHFVKTLLHLLCNYVARQTQINTTSFPSQASIQCVLTVYE